MFSSVARRCVLEPQELEKKQDTTPPPLPKLEKRTGLIQVSPKIFINEDGPPAIRLVEREKEREKFKILPPPLLLVPSALRFNKCESHAVQLIPQSIQLNHIQ